MSMSFFVYTFLSSLLWESCIWGFEVGMLSAQREHLYIAPSCVEDSTLPSGLMLALGNKVLIALNGFKHSAHNPCLQSIENRL
jgi:hypothetical protein